MNSECRIYHIPLETNIFITIENEPLLNEMTEKIETSVKIYRSVLSFYYYLSFRDLSSTEVCVHLSLLLGRYLRMSVFFFLMIIYISDILLLSFYRKLFDLGIFCMSK